MIAEVILISIGTFFGGVFTGIVSNGIYNYVQEERELRQRTHQLYLEFVEDKKLNNYQ